MSLSSEKKPDADECAREPIHIPGMVQPHGVLFVLDGDLVIRQVSANIAEILDHDPVALIGKPILGLVDQDSASRVERLIRDAASTYVNPFRVPFTVRGEKRVFDGIAHLVEGVGTIFELEAAPESAGNLAPSEGIDNYLQIIERSLSRISGAGRIETIADVMAQEVKKFTGFDRVMVYRFAPDFHGHVIAEACEEEMEPFLGLHYPASDIPAQARSLYLKNQVRLLQDVNAKPAPLVPPIISPAAGPLDMSRSVLRAMSPIHVQYLKNMGVGSSLSISLVIEDKLWGLIACHHRTPRFVPYAVRATVCLYAIVLSAQLNIKQRNWKNQRISSARKMALTILTGMRDYSEPFGGLPAMLPRFIELFEADGAALIANDQFYRAGTTPGSDVLAGLREELGDGERTGVVITHTASRKFLSLGDSLSTAAGIVAIHLGGMEWLVLFRGEIARQTIWAGDPHAEKQRSDSGALTPRNSFSSWFEEVKGEANPWPEETGALTSEVRSGILEILRKRNILLSRSNQDLRRFAGVVAHEVKNHLQTGILALSLLEERANGLDETSIQLAALGRERLSGLSKFTNDLLSFSENDANAPSEVIGLAELTRAIVTEMEASEMLQNASVKVGELPFILAPRSQIQHVLANLIRNALIHGRDGDRHLGIEVGYRMNGDLPIIFVRDDGRGIPVEKRGRIFEYFYRAAPAEIAGSGIGLAFCAQVIERLGHKLWIEDSGTGRGVSFCFTVTLASS